MLDLIIYNEETRLLFYAVAFLILTLISERYIEYKYKPFDDEMEMKQNEKSER